jgi:capsular exopolysaccharide synthesis family protein
MEVLASHKVISPLLPEIQSRYPDLDYGKLVQKLKLKNKEGTAIIEVSYQDSDREQIRFVLEKIAQGYTDYALSKLQKSTSQALKLVDNKLPLLKNRVDQLQGELQVFRRRYNIVDPEQQSQVLTERLGDISKQKQEAQALFDETISTFNSLQKDLGVDVKQAQVLSSLSEAPRYLALQQELQKLDAQLATDSTRFTDGHPGIINLREKRQRLLSLIQEEVVAVVGIDTAATLKTLPSVTDKKAARSELSQKLIETASQLQGMQSRMRSLSVAENRAIENLRQFAGITRKYSNLHRSLEIANQSLNRFLLSKENLQIETARKVSPWQVISQIEAPLQPISPSIPRDLILGGFAGLLAGLSTAIIAEKLNNKYRSPEELQEDIQQTFLGTIPFHSSLKAAPAQVSRNGTLSNSAYWESYISLQANLDFLEPDKLLRSVVISSALPGEGKSTVSLYLAKVSAAMGKKVLLIDADLRRPSVHRYLDGVTNTWGLSNVISGAAEVEQLIQTLPEEENLYILTAGETPPNPAQLLSSSKMKELMLHFQTQFDLVIIDTPPLHGFADAKYLVNQADGLVMVVGLDKTEKSAVRQVLNDLHLSHINLLGVVANGVKGYTSSFAGYYGNYYGKGKDSSLPYQMLKIGERVNVKDEEM